MLRICALASLVLVCFPSILLAQGYTDGSATVLFNLLSPAGTFAPSHVTAVWVTNGSDQFVKTVLLQANTRKGYLYQWNAAAGSETRVDGVSTATVSSYSNPMTVNWNGRDYNNNILADGTYRFHIEFTDKNGQGPYTPSATLQFTKGPTGFSINPGNLQYITGMQVSWTPVPEPVTLSLLAGGWLLLLRRRRS